MAEDRQLEPDEQLLKLCARTEIYPRFMRDLCRKADEKYNSGLFHFQKESDALVEPDRITPKLTVDDKVFKPILESLYFAHGSPYHFGVLPVEILGTVYERFLGKVIRLTAGHQAKVEEKPEVRKAGGVYYTPSYIVDYIVKQTVGRQIEGRSPAQVAGGKDNPRFRVLDMACGSGSFLLGAYRCLLDYCLKWYAEHKPETFKKAVYQDARKGHWRLTIGEKKRLLTTHVFGVDIDAQAVEVTKLSLLLKVLEGETSQSLCQQQRLFHERALPNLADNIKCGNSLIGSDCFADKLNLDPDERKRVNPFDWKQDFPEAMKAGGFDCIIGNPPYVRIHNLVDFYPLEIRYIQQEYRTAQFGKVDIYVVFVEKALSILSSRGSFGFVLPNKFMQADYGIGLRSLISERKALVELVDFGSNQVFAGATTYTCLLFLSGSPSTSFRVRTCPRQGDPQLFLSQSERPQRHQASSLRADPWSLLYERENAIFEKIQSRGKPCSKFIHFAITGVKTGANSVFVFETDKRRGATWSVKREATGESFEIESQLLRPYGKAESMKRYHVYPPTRVLLYPYELSGTRTALIPQDRMSREFPRSWDYLVEHKRLLESRQKGKLKGPSWYGLSFASSLAMFQPAKIVTPTLSPRNSFSVDRAGCFFPQGAGGGCGLVPNAEDEIPYILGILNSRLLTFFFQKISSRFQSGWFAYEPRYLRRLPVYECDLQSTEQRRRHDRIAELVEAMLRLHEQLPEARTARDKTLLQRQIDATDAEIDRLVYDLYGLTDEEIAIVEGESATR
jgi:hypothetical protein